MTARPQQSAHERPRRPRRRSARRRGGRPRPQKAPNAAASRPQRRFEGFHTNVKTEVLRLRSPVCSRPPLPPPTGRTAGRPCRIKLETNKQSLFSKIVTLFVSKVLSSPCHLRKVKRNIERTSPKPWAPAGSEAAALTGCRAIQRHAPSAVVACLPSVTLTVTRCTCQRLQNTQLL